MRHRCVILALSLVLIGVSACQEKRGPLSAETSVAAYDVELDPNDARHLIPLGYEQAQGKRVFYDKCVWCHADATPAGPSNRANLTPQPPLLNDGTVMNSVSDGFIRNIVTLGGSALGKSPMMPPWGKTLNEETIRAVVAYVRAVADPPYQPPVHPSSDYGVK